MYVPIIYAAFGGFAINLLNLIELRNVPKERRPDFKDWLYWLTFLAWPFLGAGLAFVYLQSNMKLEPILALNVGLSAPLILKSMASANPFTPSNIDPGEGA